MNFKSFLLENNSDLEQLKNKIEELKKLPFESYKNFQINIITSRLGDLEDLTSFEIEAFNNAIDKLIKYNSPFHMETNILSSKRNINSIFKNLVFFTNNLYLLEEIYGNNIPNNTPPEIRYSFLHTITKNKEESKPLINFLKSIEGSLDIINQATLYELEEFYIKITFDTSKFYPNKIVNNLKTNISNKNKYVIELSSLVDDYFKNDIIELYLYLIFLQEYKKNVKILNIKTYSNFCDVSVTFQDADLEQPDWRPNETIPEDYYAL